MSALICRKQSKENGKRFCRDLYGTVVDIDNVRLRKTPDIISNTLTMLRAEAAHETQNQDLRCA